MKILFTGASSFTGYWFVKELHEAGHEVTAVFCKDPKEYEGVRKERIDEVLKMCKPVIGTSFGDESFIELIRGGKWDLLCHHAADVTNYRSPDFDVVGALKNNTNNLPIVIDELLKVGCTHIVFTGSVFEQNEGKGTEPREAFSPYGLSKGLTWDFFRYYCHAKKINLGKFVIPNPFGPFEEPSPTFTSYLADSWLKGETPIIKSPKYFRDNIHVSLLAKAYKDFAESFVKSEGILTINPIGYQESQGDFGERFSKEMKKRLNVECPLDLFDQVDFPQPVKRFNTTVLDYKKLGWDEEKAWDELAKFYLTHYSK